MTLQRLALAYVVGPFPCSWSPGSRALLTSCCCIAAFPDWIARRPSLLQGFSLHSPSRRSSRGGGGANTRGGWSATCLSARPPEQQRHLLRCSSSSCSPE